MAETTNSSVPLADEDQFQKETVWASVLDWVRTELVWYAGSFSVHLLALSALLLLPNFDRGSDQDGSPVIESKPIDEVVKSDDEIQRIKIDALDNIQPEDLNVEPISQPPVQVARDTENIEIKPEFKREVRDSVDSLKRALGGSGALAIGNGPKLKDMCVIDIGSGTSTVLGHSRTGGGFLDIDRGQMQPGSGETIECHRAVTAALVWLAKHQLYEGNWSLQHYSDRCTDRTCTGRGEVLADAGATAMGLLPFLAAGKTHKTLGPYKEYIRKGLEWLIRHQQPDGNLAKGAAQMMYSHGLATIALCEAYGLTGDKDIGRAAQGAVNFILNAQNAADGGWRYNPKEPGDTSVFGWQLMALKSAHMAGLSVGGSAFSRTSKWLDAVSVHDGIEYAYQPGQAPAPTMTSVGLLCRQYLGAKRDNPMLTGGTSYLLNHLPDEAFPNIYYWYYATQVMHNMPGREWDTWNRKMREVLIRTQVRDVDQCANGSWAPEKDAWGRQGGRLMQTSLSTLTLEVYYRYLPLFKAEGI